MMVSGNIGVPLLWALSCGFLPFAMVLSALQKHSGAGAAPQAHLGGRCSREDFGGDSLRVDVAAMGALPAANVLRWRLPDGEKGFGRVGVLAVTSEPYYHSSQLL